jgi:hypothetical protein
MAKRSALAVLLVLAGAVAMAPTAAAKGSSATVQGATVSGLPYRYIAVSPYNPYRAEISDRPSRSFTVVGRIEKRGGRLKRWWHLPGSYSIPAAAEDDQAGGLAPDGSRLVLSRFSRIYPPRATELAILDTRLYLRHPRRGSRPRHAIRRVRLAGSFSFDAISPNGSTVYLIEYLKPYYGSPYQVRALDAKSGELLPEPIVDPAEPEEMMEGVAISRATSPGGRWAYTLYSGPETRQGKRTGEPFIHALDTAAGRAVCIDLPQLRGRRSTDPFPLLRIGQDGRRLDVIEREPGAEDPRVLLSVDTRSFEVSRPAPVATASSGIGPWAPIGIALLVLPFISLAWVVRRRG